MSEATGIVIEVGHAEQVSDSFRKRMIVVDVTDNPEYPSPVAFEFVQDKCDLLDGYGVGHQVKISYNLRGREWIDPQGVKKYFTSIQGWRIEYAGQQAPPQDQQQYQQTPAPAPQAPQPQPGQYQQYHQQPPQAPAPQAPPFPAQQQQSPPPPQFPNQQDSVPF